MTRYTSIEIDADVGLARYQKSCCWSFSSCVRRRDHRAFYLYATHESQYILCACRIVTFWVDGTVDEDANNRPLSTRNLYSFMVSPPLSFSQFSHTTTPYMMTQTKPYCILGRAGKGFAHVFLSSRKPLRAKRHRHMSPCPRSRIFERLGAELVDA